MSQSPFFLTLIANIFLSCVIVSLVFLTALVRKKVFFKVDKLVALSVGLILAIVFLGFIPELFLHGNLSWATIWGLVLFGIFLFYVFELFIHWHHCKDLAHDGHTHHDHAHKDSNLISIGTFFHNFIHWVVLFWAFSVDMTFWIATTIALLSHAIPQNIANLLMTQKDTKYVYIAAAGGIIWAFAIFPFQEILTQYSFHILAIIAWCLLYTAMSDILPSFKKQNEVSQKLLYLIFMVFGVVFFTFFQVGWEHSHEYHDDHVSESHIWEEYHENDVWIEHHDKVNENHISEEHVDEWHNDHDWENHSDEI